MSSELSPTLPPSRAARLLILGAALLLLLALLPNGFQKRSCGGNSAALHLCGIFAGEYAIWASSQGDDQRTLNAWLKDAGVELVRNALPRTFLDPDDLRVINPEAPAE